MLVSSFVCEWVFWHHTQSAAADASLRASHSPQRGGYHNNYQRGGVAGAGGSYRSQRGGRRGGRGQSRGTFQVSTRPIKFDGDFDFEEANKKFEELAAQLAKTKISEWLGLGGTRGLGELAVVWGGLFIPHRQCHPPPE